MKRTTFSTVARTVPGISSALLADQAAVRRQQSPRVARLEASGVTEAVPFASLRTIAASAALSQLLVAFLRPAISLPPPARLQTWELSVPWRGQSPTFELCSK